MARALWGAGAAVCRRGGRSPAEPTRRRSHVLKACWDVPAEEEGEMASQANGTPRVKTVGGEDTAPHSVSRTGAEGLQTQWASGLRGPCVKNGNFL